MSLLNHAGTLRIANYAPADAQIGSGGGGAAAAPAAAPFVPPPLTENQSDQLPAPY